ncbi:hypothetical protein ACWEOW_01690 [Monashia sp. NPDC004114]
MAVALEEARAAMEAHGCTEGVLAGFIHVQNNASMYMATRNGWEPLDDPQERGYLPWRRPLA